MIHDVMIMLLTVAMIVGLNSVEQKLAGGWISNTILSLARTYGAAVYLLHVISSRY